MIRAQSAHVHGYWVMRSKSRPEVEFPEEEERSDERCFDARFEGFGK